ncbi:hypothetical protein GOV11_04735 [Candidatus Woesearchaeota archaeon]|nr:hypothetical protein [Candidatus Woesearchaeota archaeon]
MRLGTIGRFRPLHLGSAALLEDLCKNSDQAIIGIGSSNRYNFRNPFLAEETREMINEYLGPRYDNYDIRLIPDFGHVDSYKDGTRWAEEVKFQFGELDGFVTGNPWTETLLQDIYHIIKPEDVLDNKVYQYIHGKQVRMKMASKKNWEKYLPSEVTALIKRNGWDERVAREFGEEIIRHTFMLYTNLEIERENISLR